MRKVLFFTVVLFMMVSFSFLKSGRTEEVLDVISAPVEAVDSDVVVADVVVTPEASDVVEDVAPVVPEVVDPEAKEVPAVPVTDEDAQEAVSFLILALQSQAWPVAIGFFLMLLVWFGNKLLKGKLTGSKWIPWITVGMGVVGTIGAHLAMGTLIWYQALLQGFLVGTSATGFWELLFKRILGNKEEEKPVVGDKV